MNSQIQQRAFDLKYINAKK